MKRLVQIGLLIAGAIAVQACTGMAEVEWTEIRESYADVTTLEVHQIAGESVFEGTDGDQVSVVLRHNYPAACVTPRLSASGSRFQYYEESRIGSCSGRSELAIAVPRGVEIDFSSASGDVVIRDVNGSVRAKTASGNITARGLTGRVDVETGSGDVRLEGVSGVIDVRTGSGDVSGRELELAGPSSFRTGSGNIYMAAGAGIDHDLDIRSGSGRSVLDYGDAPLNGHFELSARKDLGRIVSAHAFDSEEEFLRSDTIYVRKTFREGREQPTITIFTGSGTAELRRG